MRIGVDEIFELNDAFGEAWNRGDARALAGYHAEDGVRVGALGDVQRGRAEIEAAYGKLFTGSLAGATVKVDKGTVRMLGRALALWQGGMEIIPANGSRTPIRGYVIDVLERRKGRWLILESHPKFYPPHAEARESGFPPVRERAA